MEMFFYGFMQKAFISGLAMAVITPILGFFLILRRQSLLADTLSHVSLIGVALGLLWHLNTTFTTLITVIIAAFILEYISKSFKGYSEIAVAILMSGGMGLALILMSIQSGGTAASVNQFLFGSIVVISKLQVRILIGMAILIAGLFIIFRKPLYVLTFDEDTAHTAGLPVRLMSTIFTVLTGVVISIMMPIAGALLVSAIIVLPASIAMRLSKTFNGVIFIGMMVSALGIFSGLVASYQFDTPPGATITVIFTIALAILLLYSSIKEWGKRLKKH